jgi:rRNA maturation endonuclease Nob1
MTPTSDERREVAERLRQMADEHDATEASRVARALGLEYKVYGTVVAFDSAGIRHLADLIDPTCRDFGGEEGTNGECYDFACSACGYVCDLAEPRFCPNCGARVVSEDA